MSDLIRQIWQNGKNICTTLGGTGTRRIYLYNSIPGRPTAELVMEPLAEVTVLPYLK